MDDHDDQDRDCAVCLQKCHYPTQLPCGHVYCFLCVKGVAILTKKCAMCRAVIPVDYLDHPDVLALSSMQIDEAFQWYYEGANGWWKYEERHNTDLEAAYNAGATQCMMLVVGSLYSVDFQKMTQYKIRDPSRRRRVRRDTPMLPAKGIAGVKIESRPKMKSESEDSTTNDSTHGDNGTQTDDSDDEGTQDDSDSPPDDGFGNLIQGIRLVNLHSNDN